MMIQHYLPEIQRFDGVTIINDTLPGGTKGRFLWQLFLKADQVCYASSAEGTAQTALAACAARWGKKAVIFGAARTNPHPRQLQVIKFGARLYRFALGTCQWCKAVPVNMRKSTAAIWCRLAQKRPVPLT